MFTKFLVQKLAGDNRISRIDRIYLAGIAETIVDFKRKGGEEETWRALKVKLSSVTGVDPTYISAIIETTKLAISEYKTKMEAEAAEVAFVEKEIIDPEFIDISHINNEETESEEIEAEETERWNNEEDNYFEDIPSPLAEEEEDYNMEDLEEDIAKEDTDIEDK